MMVRTRASRPSLARDGYALLPALLARDEVAALAASVVDAGARRDVAACERPNNTLVALRWDDPEVDAVLADAARVARIRAASDGTDLRWTSAYVSTMTALAGPVPWHQDWWCWAHPVTRSVRAVQAVLLCYLRPTSTARGALRLIPGSHLDGSGSAREVTVAARAGDAVLLDYRLRHGTHPNTSGERRDCLILNFAPSWRDLPDDIRAHLARGFALPGAGERGDARRCWSALLPDHAGSPRDLPLSRGAPAAFAHRDAPYRRA